MFNLKNFKNINNFNTMNLNFGPQHPAAHGVLRLVLNLKNETIINSDPHIGLLHRSTEYLIKTKPYFLSLPYFDRLDYVSMLAQEHSYCLNIENFFKNKNVNIFTKIIRTLLDELTRILNHFLAIACHALDVGSMSPIFWIFEEREDIMNIYESFSGARMHACYYKPNQSNLFLNKFSKIKLSNFLKNCFNSINLINNILIKNKIWVSRLVNIGILNINNIYKFNLSGILIRSIGIKNDLRINKKTTYSYYKYLTINSFIGINGDSYDRYILRIYEILESLNVINLNLIKLNKNKNKYNFKFNNSFNTMENLIKKFKLWTGFDILKKKIFYSYIESPKGLFGNLIVGNNNYKPFKCKIRSPSYNNLFLLKFLVKKLNLADLITLIGTIDIVFGEIDR